MKTTTYNIGFWQYINVRQIIKYNNGVYSRKSVTFKINLN